jgi:hypothetical protein
MGSARGELWRRRAPSFERLAEMTMTFDMTIWGSDNLWSGSSSADAVDHWLDDALRSVPLPDGFFARLNRLADAPAECTERTARAERTARERADDADVNGEHASAKQIPTRGLVGTTRRTNRPLG